MSAGMADSWGQVLFEASWGGVRIDMTSTEDDASRNVVEHEKPHTDGALLEDTGEKARRTKAKIIFFQLSDDDDPRSRFDAFNELRGTTATFVHPIFGSYQAKVSDFNVALDAEDLDVIAVSCTFIEDTPDDPVFDLGAGAPVAAGIIEIESASAAVDTAVASENDYINAQDPSGIAPTSSLISTTVGPDAVAMVSGWDPETTSLRDARLQLDAVSADIAAAMGELRVTTINRRWPLYASLTNLAFVSRLAFEAFVATSPRMIEVTTTNDLPLLIVLAQVYGADQVSSRYDEAIALNDLHNPARVDAFTTLKLIAPVTPATR